MVMSASQVSGLFRYGRRSIFVITARAPVHAPVRLTSGFVPRPRRRGQQQERCPGAPPHGSVRVQRHSTSALPFIPSPRTKPPMEASHDGVVLARADEGAQPHACTAITVSALEDRPVAQRPGAGPLRLRRRFRRLRPVGGSTDALASPSSSSPSPPSSPPEGRSSPSPSSALPPISGDELGAAA